MEMNIKTETNKQFNNICFWWSASMMSLYMLTLFVESEGLVKYVMIAFILVCGLKFATSMKNVFNFIDKNENQKTEAEMANDFLLKKEITKRSIINYLKSFPIEHPYTLMSIVGLIITEQYTNFSVNFNQYIEHIPIINNIFPPLLVVIFFMVFADYTNHIQSKYIRRIFKLLVFIYAPAIISFFLLGLLGPFILVIKGIFTVASIQEFVIFFSNINNLFWLLIYPIMTIQIQKYIFLESSQLMDVE